MGSDFANFIQSSIQVLHVLLRVQNLLSYDLPLILNFLRFVFISKLVIRAWLYLFEIHWDRFKEYQFSSCDRFCDFVSRFLHRAVYVLEVGVLPEVRLCVGLLDLRWLLGCWVGIMDVAPEQRHLFQVNFAFI